MQGDFSRNTFDPKNQFTRVLMQQGRVQLDADWNEQIAILLHQLQTMAADIIGPHGVPSEAAGFEIKREAESLTIGKGRIYVDGLLCINEDDALAYGSQPDCSDVDELPQGNLLVYLDVWERHVTHHETAVPIREVALNGADTATRAKLVWQVRVVANHYCAFVEIDDEWKSVQRDVPNVPSEDKIDEETRKKLHDFCGEWLETMRQAETHRGVMKAMAKKPQSNKACAISPDAAYRGVENQLYRVEIHEGWTEGRVGTFKFSRENGSVIFPMVAANDSVVTVQHLGKDGRLSLKKDDWVEVVTDDTTLSTAEPAPLFQVVEVKAAKRLVTLSGAPGTDFDMTKRPFLRRWDQQDTEFFPLNKCGVVKIEAPKNEAENSLFETVVYELEKGIQIQFQWDETTKFRRGDYWLIPAREASGTIDWPHEDAIPPHGVAHQYAPLAIISGNNVHDCRKLFDPLCKVRKTQVELQAKIGTLEKDKDTHQHEGLLEELKNYVTTESEAVKTALNDHIAQGHSSEPDPEE